MKMKTVKERERERGLQNKRTFISVSPPPGHGEWRVGRTNFSPFYGFTLWYAKRTMD